MLTGRSAKPSDDITGGIDWAVMSNLARFLEEGGLLVTLGNGSTLAHDGGLVRGVRRAGDVTTPGVDYEAAQG